MADPTIGGASFRLSTDLSDFERDLQGAEGQAKRSTEEIGASFEGMGQRIDGSTSGLRRFSGAITGAIGAATGLVAILTSLIAVFAEQEMAARRSRDAVEGVRDRIDALSRTRLSGVRREIADLEAEFAALDRSITNGPLSQVLEREAGNELRLEFRAAITAQQEFIREQEARRQRDSQQLQISLNRQATRDRIEAEVEAIEFAASSEREQVRQTFAERERLVEALRGGFGDEATDALLARLDAARTFELETVRIAEAERERLQRQAVERNARAAADAFGRELERSIGTALNFNLNGAASSLEGIRSSLEIISLNGGRL